MARIAMHAGPSGESGGAQHWVQEVDLAVERFEKVCASSGENGTGPTPAFLNLGIEDIAARLKKAMQAESPDDDPPSLDDLAMTLLARASAREFSRDQLMPLVDGLLDRKLFPTVDFARSGSPAIIKLLWSLPAGERGDELFGQVLQRLLPAEQCKHPQAPRWAADFVCPPMLEHVLANGGDAQGHDGQLWENPIGLCVVLSVSKSPDDEADALRVLKLLDARGADLLSPSRYGVDALSYAELSRLSTISSYLTAKKMERDMQSVLAPVAPPAETPPTPSAPLRRNLASAGL